APILPIAFGGGAPGSLGAFFSGSLATNPNALPPAGTIDPTYIPCLSIFTGFPDGTNGAASYDQCSGGGTVPSVGIFGLEVPRHFIVPNTQQWNLTVQRDLGKNWVLELGYVGSHAIHLRETRTNVQAQLATQDHPLTVQTSSGPVQITTSTVAN